MNASPDRRGTAETNGGVERFIAEDPSVISGPENKRNGTRKTNIHEDWLFMATADPSLWLRDADL